MNQSKRIEGSVLINQYSIELDSKNEAATMAIQSSDECVQSTANLLREEFIAALANYRSKVTGYKAATIVLKDNQAEGKLV